MYPQMVRAGHTCTPTTVCSHQTKGALVSPACPLISLIQVSAYERVNIFLGIRSLSSGRAIGSIVLASDGGWVLNPVIKLALNFVSYLAP